MDETVVIIVTYNAMFWIDRCLEKLASFKIIIIDNNSSDETVEFIKINYPTIKLIEKSENIGFGQGNNLGILEAITGEYKFVFLVNQDVYIEKGALENLVRAAKENKEYGVLSPIHFNGKKSGLDNNFYKYLHQSLSSNSLSSLITKRNIEIIPVDFINAAAWLVPTEIFKIVGLFDPIFFHYGEDHNFCQRVIYHGFNVGVVLSAHISHDRENRKKTKFDIFSDEYFRIKEIEFKVKWGDINKTSVKEDYNKTIRILNNKMLKSFIKFDFPKYLNYKKENQLILKIFKEIELSRVNNMNCK